MYWITTLAGGGLGASPRASGLSARGAVCGGVYTAGGLRGAVWARGAWSAPALLAPYSYLYDLNAAGDAVGATGMDNTPTQRACLLRGGTLTDLGAHVGPYSLASGINDAGRVVGWCHPGGVKGRAFVHDAATGATTLLDPLPGADEGGAHAVNAAGEVAGRSGDRAFLWSGGTLADAGPASWVTGLNAARQIVGSAGKPSPANYAPLVIDAAGAAPVATELPLPAGAIGAHGEAINDAGVVVGSSWTADSYNAAQSAFIHEGGVSRDLNELIPASSGWNLVSALDVNNAGEIVCEGTYLGQPAVALLTPAPLDLGAAGEIVGQLIGGVAVDGGGIIVVGDRPIPIDPWGPLLARAARLDPAQRDVLAALAIGDLAAQLAAPEAREPLRQAALTAARDGLDRLLAAPALVPDTGTAHPLRDGKPAI